MWPLEVLTQPSLEINAVRPLSTEDYGDVSKFENKILYFKELLKVYNKVMFFSWTFVDYFVTHKGHEKVKDEEWEDLSLFRHFS